MAKVGVYAPTYNVAPYIDEMIKSIQSQTFQDWVLGIIDDGSTDGSYEAAVEAKGDDDRIIVKRKDDHDGRMSRIKNETIALLGDVDYLASVDSDDIIPPNTIQVFSDFLDKNPDVGAACGNFVCFNAEGKQWTFPHVANSGEFDS
jgi:glycosyltransferase involved in cell wall biosynthesis